MIGLTIAWRKPKEDYFMEPETSGNQAPLDPPEQPDEILEVMSAAVRHVARATARQGAYTRGMLYHTKVGQHLGVLRAPELERAHGFCGFLHGAGWHILDKTLAYIAGDDPELEGVDTAGTITLYSPRLNAGGWVRIFRLKSARLPETPKVVDSLVSQWLNIARLNSDSSAEVKGLFGLSPMSTLEPGPLREAILASDLFSAPWVVAMWRPDTKWVVWGVASRYLQKEADRMDFAVQDLFTRPRADQSFVVDEFGLILPGCGPSVGIEQVIAAVDYAFQTGARLDIIPEPLDGPVESWSDNVPTFTEDPLMGVLIQIPGAYWLVSFVLDDEFHWRIFGLAKKDHEAFFLATGVNPAERLQPSDFETLASRGRVIESRVESFLYSNR